MQFLAKHGGFTKYPVYRGLCKASRCFEYPSLFRGFAKFLKSIEALQRPFCSVALQCTFSIGASQIHQSSRGFVKHPHNRKKDQNMHMYVCMFKALSVHRLWYIPFILLWHEVCGRLTCPYYSIYGKWTNYQR